MSRLNRSQLKAVIESYPSSDRVSWTAGQIKRAFIAYKAGHYQDVTMLFDSMYEDDHFPGELEKRVDATLKSEFTFKLPGHRPLAKRDQKITDLFCEMAPDDELSEFMSQKVMLGVGLATIDWDTSGQYWLPKLRVLNTSYLRFDEFQKKWFFNAKDGEHEVTPGDGKWILWTDGETGWRHGLIRALGQLWLQKNLTYCDWNRYNLKHGLPIIKAKVPLRIESAEKEQFVEDLDDLVGEGIIALPQDEKGQGYDVDFLEAKDQAWESFQASIDRSDRKYSVALLGSNLGSETNSTGSNRAAAETSDLGLARNKAKGDAKSLGKVLQHQLLRCFYELNFGSQSLPAPMPYWDVCPEEDARTWSEAQLKFTQILNGMNAAGYQIDNLEELAKEYGFQLTKVATPESQAEDSAEEDSVE